MFRSIYKFLASLQFALILISVIIIASIAGTWYETQMNADVAQKYIYGAWWFNFWLTGLGVNLFCVAAVRYPWKRHQTGFVITHAGIITLLIGAMIDRMWGIEGYMNLHTTKAGANVMELHAQELRVKIGGQVAKTKFKINTLWDRMDLDSPDKDVKVEITHVLPVGASEVAILPEPGFKDTKPGMNFTLQGPMMGKHDSSLFLDERDNLGPATVVFLPGKPDVGASQEPTDSTAQLSLIFQKKTFHFALKPGETRTEALDGIADWKINIRGYYPNFIIDKNGPKSQDNSPRNPVVYFELEGPKVNGWVPTKTDKDNENEPNGHNIKQDTSLVAPHREKFFVFARNGFVMNEAMHGEPTGAEAILNAKLAKQSSSVIAGRNGVAFYLGNDNKLRYLIKHTPRAKNPDDDEPEPNEKTGEIEIEKAVPVGWAPGAEFVVHELIMNAQRKVLFIPKPELKGAKGMEKDNLNYGVLCKVTVGTESKEMWVGQTEVDRAFPQYVDIAGKRVNFEFTNQIVQIPFTVRLKEFKAPRDEGSTEFAAFESRLAFRNMECKVTLRKGFVVGKSVKDATPTAVSEDMNAPIHYNKEAAIVIDGEWLGEYRRDINKINHDQFMATYNDFKTTDGTLLRIGNDSVDYVVFKNPEWEDSISMNTPTTFPQSWYGPWLGTCYKFSQASHHIFPGDPEHSDPNYSGVQVLRDPGWFFKWFGCIMINFGIFTMFYLRPYFNRPKNTTSAAVAAGAAVESSKKKKKK